jgi:hypothetical protein
MSSERYSVTSPDSILTEWTIDDVCHAHDVLDMYDELEALAHERARAK